MGECEEESEKMTFTVGVEYNGLLGFQARMVFFFELALNCSPIAHHFQQCIELLENDVLSNQYVVKNLEILHC
uniref:Uncharacterized protein n=1 Tax=Angiostrongylus cantonensis TaxID=6313 RepID=A0A0K0CU07_ANGCA